MIDTDLRFVDLFLHSQENVQSKLYLKFHNIAAVDQIGLASAQVDICTWCNLVYVSEKG